MSDAAVRDLARRAGIAVRWTDFSGKRHRVPLDTIRRILAAMGLPCDTPTELSQSGRILDETTAPTLITATTGQPIELLLQSVDARARVALEGGRLLELPLHPGAQGSQLPAIDTAGYHTVEVGQTSLTLAVAPPRCLAVEDIAPGERIFGLAAQIYGLRSRGDCGIGDMAGAGALAKAAAALDADALALSPTHAMFAADPNHFSPYSPSSRLFYNPLHADAAAVCGQARVAEALSEAGSGALAAELEALAEVDWARATRAKMAMFRRLFDDFCDRETAGGAATALAADFAEFQNGAGAPLQDHALFEALHAARLKEDPAAWNWRDWPAPWRDPRSDAVKSFAQQSQYEIRFHCFLQWLADRSFAAAQARAKEAGMRLGLIADLAVGMSSGGSHAWTSQDAVLGGLTVGAPPDLFNKDGQNWGLTTFSPRALTRGGFAPFIATLRASMRHAGGVRIDHAMGFMRLWVVPHGAKASEGAYLAYPLDDLLRLTALESHRHRAIVIGEDLGTVPAGFGSRLTRAGLYGMRVLWFERDEHDYAPPDAWSTEAAAMTSTHDLPTVAGWWRGVDLEARARLGLVKNLPAEQAQRDEDRNALWKAFQSATAGEGDMPAPDDAARAVDASVAFIAKTPSRLALLPLEDALALDAQPNLPATIDEYPNWRRRYDGDAGTLLDAAAVRRRLDPLRKRGAR